MRLTRCIALLAGFSAIGLFAHPSRAEVPLSTEQPTPHQWIVKSGPQTLLAYTFAPDQAKPYVRELSPLRGANILRDSPVDHKHHHGLMFAIRVNGVNFWEEAPGAGIQRPVGTPALETGPNCAGHLRARLTHRIHWLAEPDAKLADTTAATLLIEDRTLTATADESTGEVALRWQARFQVGTKAPEVTLTGSNYFGLGMRFLMALDPFAAHSIAGTAPDLSGNRQSVTRAPWGAVAFPAPGQPAPANSTIALFGSPRNPGGEAHYFTMKNPFAYLSATAGLDQTPLRYKTGDTFTFDYLVTVYPEVKPADFLARRGERWTARMTQPAL